MKSSFRKNLKDFLEQLDIIFLEVIIFLIKTIKKHMKRLMM